MKTGTYNWQFHAEHPARAVGVALVAAIPFFFVPSVGEEAAAAASQTSNEEMLTAAEMREAPPAPALSGEYQIAESRTPADAPIEGQRPDRVIVKASPVVDAFRLGIGDRLRMRFYDRYDRADLDGEYLVNDNGLIRLPRIGDFVALDKSISELEQDIRITIEQLGEKPGHFTVDRTQMRPFYVAGFANHPGVFAFTPGLTVLHAVALAGGVYRSASLNPVDRIREKRLRAEKVERLKMLLSKRARLEAERGGLDRIKAPSELIAIDPVSAEALIGHEQDLLHRHSELTVSKHSAVEEIVRLTKDEAESYQEALVSTQTRIAELTRQFNDIKALRDRNIISQQRFLETVIALDNAERDRQQTISNLAHTKVNLAKAASDLSMLKQLEEVRISKEMSEVEFEIIRTKAEAENSQKVIGAFHDLGGETDAVSYRIMRRRANGEYSFIDASETTPIEPGDVVQIGRLEYQTNTLN